MINVAPLREFNLGVFLLPVLEKFLVAALVSIGERVFLLERLATEELVELNVVPHSPAAADQNLLENLVVPACGKRVIALAHTQLKGGLSTSDDRILQVQEAGIRAVGFFLFGNKDLRIDNGIVAVVALRFHIDDVSLSSILVDEVAVGLGNPLTFGLRHGIESVPARRN